MKKSSWSWKAAAGIGMAALVGLAIAALIAAAQLWTEYQWFNSMGRASVFLTRALSRGGVWLAATAVGFAVLFSAALYARKVTRSQPRSMFVAVSASLALAALSAWTLSGQWAMLRLAASPVSFGLADPQFGLDVSFFVFILPALEALVSWFTGLVLLAALLSFAIILLPGRDGGIAGGMEGHWRDLKPLGFVLLGALMLATALGYRVSIWQLDLSSRMQLVGASYADIHAQLPALWALTGLTALLAVVFMATARSQRWAVPAVALAVWVAATIVLGQVWPATVENYVVAPNEASVEAPYISRNIEMTRRAFGLDSARGQGYAARESLDSSGAALAERSLEDAPVWEPFSVKQGYQQLQTIRPYYRLSSIAVDRYDVNGEPREVLVAAREIDTSGLPKRARTWVNEHLVYTHGYGIAIGSASGVTEQGFPRMLVGDVPPRVADEVAAGSPSLKVTEPRVYYGPDVKDYAIVDTTLDEFDYPAGERNVSYRHPAKDGIPLGGLLSRLAWAVRLRSDQLLFSEYLTPKSQMLVYRDVATRVSKLAPWLTTEKQPYPAVVDGRIVWILDAYTRSDHFPYSQPLSDGTNYLRNSVKVAVDASSGKTTFYAVGEDPVRDAYASMYPGLITPEAEIPKHLAEHFRVPQKLLSAQAKIYRTYHMTDPQVFYNKEDQWRISGEKDARSSKPQYLMLDLPDDGRGKGLYLMQPYAPANRDNLVAWLATSCEPESYGEQTVYLLPKDRVVLGPQQIMARIEQDPVVSPRLSLWDQRGSRVVFGDMLVVPVAGGVTYIQPVFLQAEKSAISQLVSVIVVDGERVTMADSLPEALAQAYGTSDSGAARVEEILAQLAAPGPDGTPQFDAATLEQVRDALRSAGDAQTGEATTTP